MRNTASPPEVKHYADFIGRRNA